MRKSIIRTLSLVIMISILASAFAVSAYAAGESGYINRDSVNMRSTPNGTIIANYNLGTKLTLITESGQWCQVNVGGTIGWVYGKYVSLGTQDATTTGLHIDGYVTTTTKAYAGCSFDSRVINSNVTAGTYVEIMTQEDSGWCGVTLGSQRAYIYGSYVAKGSYSGGGSGSGGSGSGSGTTIGSEGYINRDAVNFRSSPNGPVIGNFNIGTKLTLLGESNKWCQVKINGVIGYVYGTYVSLGTQSNTTTGINQAGYVNAALVNMRAGASSDSRVLRTVSLYTKLTIVTEENSGWCGVIVNGQRGYIYGAYVSKGNPPA